MKKIIFILFLLFNSNLWAEDVQLADSSFSKGEKASEVVSVPDAANEVMVVFSNRDQWPDIGNEKAVANFLLDLSVDGGNTWDMGYVGMAWRGGVYHKRNGDLVTDSYFKRAMPNVKSRKVRLRIISETDLTSVVTVKFL